MQVGHLLVHGRRPLPDRYLRLQTDPRPLGWSTGTRVDSRRRQEQQTLQRIPRLRKQDYEKSLPIRSLWRIGDVGEQLFPHTAQKVDDLTLLYSMQADSNNHAPASYQLHTGDIRSGKASLGSWVTYGLGSENQDLPGYVVLFDAGPWEGLPIIPTAFSHQPINRPA